MRTAIVTGSSSGIGLAVAVELASRNWRVVGIDSADDAGLIGTAEFAGVASGIQTLMADVTDRGQVDSAVAQVLSAFSGRLDALVNCAGTRVGGPFEETPERVIRQQIEVNMVGAMNVTRAALPGLRAVGGSRLVNLSSAAGLSSVPGLAGYCGSRWGLEGWTEAIAHELRPLGIGVVLVEPVAENVDTDSGMPVYGDPDGAYGPLIGKVARGGRGLDPITVADSVVAAVEGRRRLRQPVGMAAHMRCAARGVIPAGFARTAATRAMGLEPGRPSTRHADGVIMVTGCSTGFGLDIVVELARRGRRVAATMRDISRRGALDAALATGDLAERVEILAMDVTDPGSVYDVFTRVDRWEELAGEKGRLIGVVNNAGVRAVGAFEEIPSSEVDHMIEVNLFGTLAVTRAALPRMRAHGGRIVFLSSSSALVGEPTWSAYAATKWAVEGWAESLAYETAPHGIDLLLVEPGAFRTELNRPGTVFGSDDGPYHLVNEAMAEAERRQLERAGDRSDVARVVAGAFDSRWLPTRRPVGRDAKIRWAARGVVPFGVQRWARERTLGLQ